MPALDEGDWDAEDAVHALVSIGAEAVAPLVSALPDADDEFAASIGSARGSIGEPVIVPVDRLAKEPPTDRATSTASRRNTRSASRHRSIGQCLSRRAGGRRFHPWDSGEPRGGGAHRRLPPDEDRDVANAAMLALFELGELAIDALLAALAHPRSWVRIRDSGPWARSATSCCTSPRGRARRP